MSPSSWPAASTPRKRIVSTATGLSLLAVLFPPLTDHFVEGLPSEAGERFHWSVTWDVGRGWGWVGQVGRTREDWSLDAARRFGWVYVSATTVIDKTVLAIELAIIWLAALYFLRKAGRPAGGPR